MAEYISIRIRKDLAEQMQIIKKQNNYKSINELLEKTLDKTVNENLEIIHEQALFYVGNTNNMDRTKTKHKWYKLESRKRNCNRIV